MASNWMCPHVVTLYNRNGEDADGIAQYVVTVLNGVYFRESRGVTGLSAPEDQAVAHIFDDIVSAVPGDGTQIDTSLASEVPEGERPFMDWDKWEKTTDREQFWTLRDGGTDFIARGDTHELSPKAANAYRITAVKRNDAGSRRMWNWRVTAN